MNTAAKKYAKDLIIAFSVYAAVLFSVNTFISGAELPQWQQALLVLLPMIPVLMFARAVFVFSRAWDELQYRKAMDATLVAFVLVGFGTFAYGFLEGVGFPKLNIIWVLPLLLGVQGVAQIFVARKYQ